ncbi:heterokaryon incompatibility protein-domain-containing protein, partial [Microdochium bolleyi]
GIKVATLSQSFQDAIKIALEIGVRFIWIDSLCIIQDCPQDWLEQSVQMQHIYGQSFCNIAATVSADGGGGCFRTRRTEALRPVKLRWEEYKGKPSVHERYLTDAGLWWDRFEREPLNRRAWVLQERMLAPRLLHYDHDQVVWECNELTATERFPRGLGRLIGASNATSILRAPLEPNLRVDQEHAVAGRALAEIWRPVVRLYTTLAITRWTDRLIALAGVGQRIQDRLGWDYVAGMF